VAVFVGRAAYVVGFGTTHSIQTIVKRATNATSLRVVMRVDQSDG
jgi:hypothetical protein